jgi:negative regulator of replication initiation
MKAMSIRRRDRYNSAKEMRAAWLNASEFLKKEVADLPVTVSDVALPPTERATIQTSNEDEKKTLIKEGMKKIALPETLIDSVDKTTELSKTKTCAFRFSIVFVKPEDK